MVPFHATATTIHRYCQHNPAVPNPGPDEQVADGDFDGDGFFDRIRLQRRPDTSDFALWFAAGNGTSLVSKKKEPGKRERGVGSTIAGFDVQGLGNRGDKSRDFGGVW